MILVPHEPTPDHLSQLERQLANHGLIGVRLSQIDMEKEKEEKTSSVSPSVLLVDRVGVLANLYSVGQVALVGGGFGPGVHNVLEAAVHGVPVLVGPRFHNSPEAMELAESGLLTPVLNIEECQQKLFALLRNPEMRREKGARHREFVLARCGASAKIIDILARYLKDGHGAVTPS
jgi:3-deoxy-D-manno-octulosonic-acid transferase